MPETPTPALGAASTVTVRPWVDPVIDDDGFDPRSCYVETFWLGILGPTATFILRRLVAGLDRSPEGYQLDLASTAQAMGLGYSEQRSSAFGKALQRCMMFGAAHDIPGGLAVRRRLPPVAYRHLRRMPPELQVAHEEWARTTVSLDELTRAHRLAVTMVDVGDDRALIEYQLLALGVRGAVASAAADNASQLAINSAG